MWANLSMLSNSILTGIVNYGTDNYSRETARRLRQTNAFNRVATAKVAAFRDPLGRPPGLPDWPFRNLPARS